MTYPLLIDGGLSNVLEAQGCDLHHPLWTARLLDDNPEAIVQAHLRYLDAGARCLITSSYQASIPGFVALGYDREAAEAMLLQTVVLAEQAIERFRDGVTAAPSPLIAASIGPYGAYLADGSEYRGDYDVPRERLLDFHRERMQILDRTRADLFACETIPSVMEAGVLADLLHYTQKPAWISFSCRDEQHLNDGTPIKEAASMLAMHSNIFAIGVNCTAPSHISGLIQAIKPVIGAKKIVVYPNSGETYHTESKTWMGIADPDAFLAMAKEWYALGADILGGCCRIGPRHIQSVQKTVFPR